MRFVSGMVLEEATIKPRPIWDEVNRVSTQITAHRFSKQILNPRQKQKQFISGSAVTRI
jgi:hypothetical protein